MRTKEEIISRLTNPGIVAIVRAQQAAQVVPLFEALIAGGVEAIEITMTTPNALAGIREAREKIGERAVIGVGTVLEADTCRAAMAAGAEFVVTPICRTELVGVAHAGGCPIMLGAYTPTEAQTAHEAGADFIKIFPAETLGPGYIKALRAPLPHLRIVPTGGVDEQNVGQFFRVGCAAVGVGSSLVSAKILHAADWAELTRRANALVSAARQAQAPTLTTPRA
jgi:2-dehydro-3-deoxyphosphogluconate aldolase / (4S)-4-hydroxy-2-oxoglutarate aldolase